jgi:hypothetical protein
MLSLYGIDCSEEPVPSFMLMDLQGMSLVLYIYTLENGQIKVEKVIVPETVLLIVAVVSERGVITVLRNSIDTNGRPGYLVKEITSTTVIITMLTSLTDQT